MRERKVLYDIVRARLRIALSVEPPAFFIPEALDLNLVKNYLLNVFNKTNFNDGFSVSIESLINHLEIMDKYFEVLMGYPNFSDLVKKIFPQKSEAFLSLLVWLHDYSRFIFNGPFSLTYGDWVSSALLKKKFLRKIFPNNDQIVEKLLNCFHSIDWITGKSPLPEDNNQLSDEQKLGLILKTIDTLAKKESDGRLRDPNVFFAENGSYYSWLRFQEEKNRFPLKIKPNQFIDAITYAQNDIALTQRGIALIENLTGTGFSVIKDQVESGW